MQWPDPDSREPITVHELIGLIYDAAEDPDLWPMLLMGLIENLTSRLPSSADPERPHPADNPLHTLLERLDGDQLSTTLLPHFQRALRLNRRLVESHQQQDRLLGILEHLPLGVILADESAKIRAMNTRARESLEGNGPLRLRHGRLSAATMQDTIALQDLIRTAVVNPDGGGTLQLSENPALSLMILPCSDAGQEEVTERCCTMFVATTGLGAELDAELLQELFGLSRAEARLAQTLALGHSIESAAAALHVSPHTVRTQLKALFTKTGTRRQPELLQKLLTSHAMLRRSATPAPHHKPLLSSDPVGSQQLRLAGGRALHYAEHGDPDGVPVLFLHSIVGSRLQIHPDNALVANMGIRWIVPDRPGFGRSDPQPGRRLLDWAEDLAALADHLELARFYLAGYSAGGAHAAACAWRLPERIIATALISPMAPFTSLAALAGMPPTNRMLLAMARYTPALLGPFMRVMLQGLIRDPAQITHRHAELWPAADREAMDVPGTRDHQMNIFCEAVRQGPDALVTEQILLAGDWGFDPGEIDGRVDIWHGDADIHVPLAMLEPLRQIPDHHLRVIPGRGHYLLLTQWQEIFETLLRPSAPLPASAI